MRFMLTSTYFQDGGFLLPRDTWDGEDFSPKLHWRHPPQRTQSFVLIMEDPDAPENQRTHWVLYDIPSQRTGLPEGSQGIGVSGQNDFDTVGYYGPSAAEEAGPHRYRFTLYALDVASLELAPGAEREKVECAMQLHVLGETRLHAHYEHPRA